MSASLAAVAAEPATSLRGEVRDLGRLTGRDVAYNLTYLASAWALSLLAIAVFAIYPAWWTFLLAFLVVAARQQALLNIEHECVHSNFVRGGKVWNERVAVALAASPVGSPFYAARARHLEHHRLLGREGDPDGELHKGPDKERRVGVLRHFALGVLGGYAVMVLLSKSEVTVDARARRRDRQNLILSQLIIAAVLTVLFGWWAYPFLWLAPLVTLTTACHLLRNFCEHAITDREAETHGNRLISIRSNPIERFVVSPFFMNFHAEHHLFPFVPARRLPVVQERLRRRIDAPVHLLRRSYLGALAGYVRSLQ